MSTSLDARAALTIAMVTEHARRMRTTGTNKHIHGCAEAVAVAVAAALHLITACMPGYDASLQDVNEVELLQQFESWAVQYDKPYLHDRKEYTRWATSSLECGALQSQCVCTAMVNLHAVLARHQRVTALFCMQHTKQCALTLLTAAAHANRGPRCCMCTHWTAGGMHNHHHHLHLTNNSCLP
jgi:hypothetical protein